MQKIIMFPPPSVYLFFMDTFTDLYDSLQKLYKKGQKRIFHSSYAFRIWDTYTVFMWKCREIYNRILERIRMYLFRRKKNIRLPKDVLSIIIQYLPKKSDKKKFGYCIHYHRCIYTYKYSNRKRRRSKPRIIK